MYTIGLERRERILRLTPEGLWTTTTLAAFTAELLRKTGEARQRHGTCAVLSLGY